MTEEVQSQPASLEAPEEPSAEPTQPLLGELLIAARERWNLSAADLARQLRLGLRQVQALEENNFDELPGNTFVRGFIRNYARVVQTEPEAFLNAYERNRPQLHQPDIERHSSQIAYQNSSTPKWVWYITAVIVLALVSPLMIYFTLRDEEGSKIAHGSTSNKFDTQAPIPATALTPASPQIVLQHTAPNASSATLVTTPLTQQNPTEVATTTTIAPAAGNASLLMNFSGEAWVEIRDQSGKIIFSRLNHSGQEEVVQGKPPLTLVVGNARKVRIAYNGKPIDLAPHTKIDVARFKLE